MDSRLLAFIGVAALLTIAPGPDMALVLRNALRGGRPTVVPTAAGICTGCIVWGAASSLGVAALLAASAQLYQGLKLAGAAYLVFLGVCWRCGPRYAVDPQKPRPATSPGLGPAPTGRAC
jgi:threonine/homoserine/homoserine lactone efflux protein